MSRAARVGQDESIPHVWPPRILGGVIALGALVFVLPDATMDFGIGWSADGPSTAFSVGAPLIVGAVAVSGGVLFALRRPPGWWLMLTLGIVSLGVSIVLLAVVFALEALDGQMLRDALIGLFQGVLLIGLLLLRPFGGPGAHAWRGPRAVRPLA